MLNSKLEIKPRKNNPCDEDTETQVRKVMKQIAVQIKGQNISEEGSQGGSGGEKKFGNYY